MTGISLKYSRTAASVLLLLVTADWCVATVDASVVICPYASLEGAGEYAVEAASMARITVDIISQLS
jgi:hypothetical protein